MYKNIILTVILFLIVFTISTSSFAQPTALHDDLSIEKVMDVEDFAAVRVDVDPATQELYYVTVDGNVNKVDIENGTAETIFTSADHGLEEVYGFDIGASGNIYLVSMDPDNSSENVAFVKKYDGETWTTMVTATYPRSSRDHRFNTVIETPDQQHILVNSGARTDHGELKSNDQRENAFTAKLLKFPVSTEGLVLEDDDDFMSDNGYIFAAGLRNMYDVEYNADGLLFGVDQAPQSDHQEELNWIREGHHFGFPWRIGDNENLMQYPGYNPPDSDPLVTDVNMESTFHNDPDFPAPPDSVTFTHPVVNFGPDQDIFRDTVDTEIKDASDIGHTIATYTPHSAPVALTFDTAGALGGEFNGMAYSMSYSNTNDRKFEPFDQIGEDLLRIDLEKAGDNYHANIYRIAQDFSHPVDAVLIGNKMYVIENASDAAIWEVTFPHTSVVSASVPEKPFDFKLNPAHPNPFNPTTNITYSLGQPGAIKINVYDMLGRSVAALVDGVRPAGDHQVQFDAGGLSSGLYFVRMEASGFLKTQKIMLLK